MNMTTDGFEKGLRFMETWAVIAQQPQVCSGAISNRSGLLSCGEE